MKRLLLSFSLLLSACATGQRNEFTDAPGTTVYEVESCLKDFKNERPEGAKRATMADDCFDKAIHVLKEEPTLRARTFYMHALHYKYEAMEDHTWLIVGHYDKLFEEKLREPDLQGIDTPTLEKLFEVTDWLTFYSHDLTYAVDQENVYRELKRRRREKTSQLRKVYASHVRTRMFDRAEMFRNDFPHPSLKPLPDVEYPEEDLDEMRPMGYTPNNGKLRIRQVSPPGKGPRIEVVFDPGNPEAKKTFEALLADKRLGPKLAGVTRVVVEQTHWRFEEVVAWNEAHPEAPATIAYLQDAWEWIPEWRTSLNFAFYEDGVLKGRAKGSRKEVLSGLLSIKL